jgi:hypothetical protein
MGKAAKDLAAVNAGLVTMGKLHGLLTDVVGFDPAQLRQLTEAQEREARRISSLILDNTITGTGNESAMLQSQPDIIPASNNSAMLQSIGPAVDPAGVVPSLETDATAQAMAHAALDGIDGVQPGPGAAGIDTSLTTVSTESDQGTKGTMQTSAPDTTGTDSRGTPANPPTGAASNNDIPHPDASDFGACLGDLEISTLPCLPVSEAVPQSPAGGSENSTDVPVRAKRVKSEFEEWYDEAHKKWKRRRVYPAESVVLNGGDIPSGDQRDGTAGEVRGERLRVGDPVGDGGECGGNGG